MAVRITGAGVALTVGIIVVTGLIIGGLFWARQSGDQARRDEAVKIAEEQLKEESSDVALNEGDETQDESQANGSEQGATSESEGTIPSTGADVEESAPVTELPQTGPAETISSLIAIGGLSFATAAYLASRQKLRDSL